MYKTRENLLAFQDLRRYIRSSFPMENVVDVAQFG